MMIKVLTNLYKNSKPLFLFSSKRPKGFQNYKRARMEQKKIEKKNNQDIKEKQQQNMSNNKTDNINQEIKIQMKEQRKQEKFNSKLFEEEIQKARLKQQEFKKKQMQNEQKLKRFNEEYSKKMNEQKQKKQSKQSSSFEPKNQKIYTNKQFHKILQDIQNNIKLFYFKLKINLGSRNLIFFALSIFLFLIYYLRQQNKKHISYTQILKILDQQNIQSIVIKKTYDADNHQTKNVQIITKQNKKYYSNIQNIQSFQQQIYLTKQRINDKLPPILIKNDNPKFFKINQQVTSLLIIIGLGMILYRLYKLNGSGINQQADKKDFFSGLQGVFGKDKKVRQIVNVKFKNVAGMQSAKKQIVEFVEFLKNPKKFHKLGARIPRGALLTGPPGTGKTMLAKACAGEAGVSFYSLSGSEFVEMYVGVGASRVRNLFKQAREAAPSIIFIDQIDAIGKKRSSGELGGNQQKDNTLNQLLVEMDGFNTQENVIVFAATNRKQMLDSALTRPGRFDRIIDIDLPNLQQRKQIFQVHLVPLKLQLKDMTLQQYAKRLATLTPGFSGAQIQNLCNQAAIMAARINKQSIQAIDFQLATERIIGGVQRKSKIISEAEKKVVAYHQCGHGVVSWYLPGASPLLKLTIIPRSKGALGFAQYLPDNKNILSRQDLFDQLCVILAGRITQQIVFNRITNGAQDDLDKATTVAKKLVKDFGMSIQLNNMQYQDGEFLKEYSNQSSKRIDRQVSILIEKATEKTRELVVLHREKIQKLAECLLKQQTIDNKKIEQILGTRSVVMSDSLRGYIQNNG